MWESNDFHKAPTLIIVSGDEKAIAPQWDCTLANGTMFLAAASIEIASCWIHALTQVNGTEEDQALKKWESYDWIKLGCNDAKG